MLDRDGVRIGRDLLCSRFWTPVLKVSWLIRLAQLAFVAALIFTFYSAVIPPQKAVQLVPGTRPSTSSHSTP